MRSVRIGLLGCGTVGGGFVELLARERERILARYGVDISVTRVLVRDLAKRRCAGLDASLLTTSALEVIDADCDLVVELIGGVHTAGALVRRAIALGKDVVTANKALLAAAGAELFASVSSSGTDIGFEASVSGGVPVIAALRGGLAGDSIERISGVLNGTSNYILCRMDDGMTLGEALAQAQALGFAEADATLDLSGEDSAQKVEILAQLAFDAPVRRRTVCGIEDVTPEDIRRARRAGAVIRLIAEARRVTGGVEIDVAPRPVPHSHAFGRIENEHNAVIIRGRAVGEVCLSGRGAGSMPTATAVLSDVIALARRRREFVAA